MESKGELIPATSRAIAERRQEEEPEHTMVRMPRRGELSVTIMYRDDNGELFSVDANLERWDMTTILTGRLDGYEQLFIQFRSLFYKFCRAIFDRYGLGAIGHKERTE